MLKTLINRAPILSSKAVRYFSVSAPKNAFNIRLAGTAQGFTQHVIAEGEGITNHEIRTDCFKSFGGEDLNPDPIQYLFASIGGCQQITAHLVAKDLGIKLGKANVVTEADLTPSTIKPGTLPAFRTKNVTINYEVETDATDEQFEELRETTEAKCPIANIFINSHGLKFNSNWTKIPLK